MTKRTSRRSTACLPPPLVHAEAPRLGSLHRVCALLCVAALWCAPRLAAAAGSPVLIEISDAAEALLDARATRRLVRLELLDIQVAPPLGDKRGLDPLFFRVVQQGADLRVELWQRGEAHGARLVSGSGVGGQLSARRVALAAAELARRLKKKRQLAVERERLDSAARAVALAEDEPGAQASPLALRSSVAAVRVGSRAALLAGPRLLAQWTFARRARVDAGLSWLLGRAPSAARTEWLELSLAPSRRVTLSSTVDLDLGAELAAAWVRLAHVRGVDLIADQNETWSARATALVRLEPRLSRRARLSVGATGGLLLREVPFQPLSGGIERLHGLWLGLDLGVVLTSP